VNRRRRPRKVAQALQRARGRVQPKTLLAAVQTIWPQVAGEAVAAEASPVAEREGVVTIACRTATWAQELDLLQVELLERLRRALPDAAETPLEGLRFSADAARHRN
jgi:predicted nucleic acid-binding Zn ribbon protein